MNFLNKLGHVVKLNKGVFRKHQSSHLFNIRHLYAPVAMGLDSYEAMRERTKVQFANTHDRFKAKMAEFADEKSKHMIFTEDLKAMVHLVESDDDDLNTLRSMIKKFNSQNKELRFGSFIFGPVVMRMYYFLNRPIEALESFQDETLSGFFDQLISYQLLMDLLFINKMYDKVELVFEIIREKQLQPTRYPKNVTVLYFAALYKLNTKESLEKMTELWKELKELGYQQMRKSTAFAAALALNQGASHIALEILSNEYNQSYITVRNLKAWALADLGRPDDILPILRTILNADNPVSQTKQTFLKEVMQSVRRAFENCSDKEVKNEFERVEKQLISHDMITSETLDSILCSDIQKPLRKDINQRDQFLHGNYRAGDYRRNDALNRIGRSGGSQYRQRPGLSDLN